MRRADARGQATKVVSISIEEARALPGILGQIVALELEMHGWYACKHAGVTTYYEVSK